MPQTVRGYDGKFYKFTKAGGVPANGGRPRPWSLPTKVEGSGGVSWTPGKWRSVKGNLRPCNWGLHAATTNSLSKWMAEECYEIEYADGSDLILHAGGRADEKVVGRKARLVRKCEAWTPQNIAHVLAGAALSTFTRYAPRDERLTNAIATLNAHQEGNEAVTPLHLLAAMGEAYAIGRELALLSTYASSDAKAVATAVGDLLHSVVYTTDSAVYAKRAYDALKSFAGAPALNAAILSLVTR